MDFDENNGSQVEKSGLYEIGDEIHLHAIRRMGVGHFLPVEAPLVAQGEGQCSTHVEPSPTQDPQASEEQTKGPQPCDLDQGEDQPWDGSAPSDVLDQAHPSDVAQDQGQAHRGGQGQKNVPPQLSIEDILER